MVKTFARFFVFARGRIVGKAEEGAKEKHIQSFVKKTNGKRGSLRAIRAIIKHSRDDPEYEGGKRGVRPGRSSSHDLLCWKRLVLGPERLERWIVRSAAPLRVSCAANDARDLSPSPPRTLHLGAFVALVYR